ncbi:charged multivesicular body protein 4b-like [Centruroides sculpturatus]|uniref:charged multivesicular body protein 4b-like n=1 Tax=Centruroides sculpturatus TaxID=218467 RepID=UPI000C6EDA11|nr:charged multivesicular body protein 4b-like [Centruroides sculpturatus]
MSFLGKLFGGGKSQEKTPSPAEAIQRLRDIEEMLMKKQEYLEKKVEQELALAKKNGRTNRRVAIQALKRKKRYEKQLGQIDGTLTTIEFQREALENANTNTEVLKIMGIAAKALKGTHSDMDVDKVHDLMDEVQEQQDIANEISEAISSPIGFGNDVDEDELARELDELEQESLDEQLLDVAGPATENLPSPPTAEPISSRKKPAKPEEEDDDMKELAAWAS